MYICTLHAMRIVHTACRERTHTQCNEHVFEIQSKHNLTQRDDEEEDAMNMKITEKHFQSFYLFVSPSMWAHHGSTNATPKLQRTCLTSSTAPHDLERKSNVFWQQRGWSRSRPRVRFHPKYARNASEYIKHVLFTTVICSLIFYFLLWSCVARLILLLFVCVAVAFSLLCVRRFVLFFSIIYWFIHSRGTRHSRQYANQWKWTEDYDDDDDDDCTINFNNNYHNDKLIAWSLLRLQVGTRIKNKIENKSSLAPNIWDRKRNKNKWHQIENEMFENTRQRWVDVHAASYTPGM